jgi:N-acyl-L-homoserine lactone synthetase
MECATCLGYTNALITVRFVAELSLSRDLTLTHWSAQLVTFEKRHSNVVIVALRVNVNTSYMNIYRL